MENKKDIEYGLNLIIEETEGEVLESHADNYKYKVNNSGNTTSKLFHNDQEFIRGAAKEVGE